MAISLSFSIISKLLGLIAALFKPSNANPPDMDASPITAITFWSFSCFRLAATAIPKAAEIELDACPAIKASYSLSLGFGKPLIPLNLRFVENKFFLPVKIL